MKFDFAAAQRGFWETAPDKPGFKPVYAAMFCGMLSLLEDACARSIDIDFMLLHGRTKVSEDAYKLALDWLSEHGFWQYIKGVGRYQKARIYVDVPEAMPVVVAGNSTTVTIIPDVTPEFYPGKITPCNGVGTGVGNGVCIGDSTGGGMGVGSCEIPKIPPHPPIEVNNNINTTSQQANVHTCEGVFVPSNLKAHITPDELNDLLGIHGPKRTTMLLAKISCFMRDKGKLAKSVYSLANGYALKELLAEERLANQPGLPPTLLPALTTGILPRPKQPKQPD